VGGRPREAREGVGPRPARGRGLGVVASWRAPVRSAPLHSRLFRTSPRWRPWAPPCSGQLTPVTRSAAGGFPAARQTPPWRWPARPRLWLTWLPKRTPRGCGRWLRCERRFETATGARHVQSGSHAGCSEPWGVDVAGCARTRSVWKQGHGGGNGADRPRGGGAEGGAACADKEEDLYPIPKVARKRLGARSHSAEKLRAAAQTLPPPVLRRGSSWRPVGRAEDGTAGRQDAVSLGAWSVAPGGTVLGTQPLLLGRGLDLAERGRSQRRARSVPAKAARWRFNQQTGQVSERQRTRRPGGNVEWENAGHGVCAGPPSAQRGGVPGDKHQTGAVPTARGAGHGRSWAQHPRSACSARPRAGTASIGRWAPG